MNMKMIIKKKMEELLSKEFYCCPNELNGKSTVYTVNFNAKQPVYLNFRINRLILKTFLSPSF